MLNANAIIANNGQFVKTLQTLSKHPERLHAACVFAVEQMLKCRGDNSGLINGNATPAAQVLNSVGRKEVSIVRKWFKVFAPEIAFAFDAKTGKYTAAKAKDAPLVADGDETFQRYNTCLTIGPLDKPAKTEDEKAAEEIERLVKLGKTFNMANKLKSMVEQIEKIMPYMHDVEREAASVFISKASNWKLHLSEGQAKRNEREKAKAAPKTSDISAIETHRAQAKAVGRRAMNVTKIDKSHNPKAPRGVGIESIKAVSAALAS